VPAIGQLEKMVVVEGGQIQLIFLVVKGVMLLVVKVEVEVVPVEVMVDLELEIQEEEVVQVVLLVKQPVETVGLEL